MTTIDAPKIALGWQNWVAGGIIQRTEWDGPGGTVGLYMGRTAEVKPGDTLIVFRTAGTAQVLNVEEKS